MAQRARTAAKARIVRHRRVRQRVRGVTERPRLAVYRSLNHIYAQVIDDSRGATVAAASTLEAPLRAASGRKVERAAQVGELLAKRAGEAGVKSVVFDRGGFRYHGRVRALAEAARKGGLVF